MEPSDVPTSSNLSIQDIMGIPELREMILQDKIPDVADKQAMASTSKQFQDIGSELFDADENRRPHVARGRIKLLADDAEAPWKSMSAAKILRHPDLLERWLLLIDYTELDLAFLMFWLDPKSNFDQTAGGLWGFAGDVWELSSSLRSLERDYYNRGVDVDEVFQLREKTKQSHAEQNVENFVQACGEYAIALYVSRKDTVPRYFGEEQKALLSAWLSPRLTVRMRRFLRLLFSTAGCNAYHQGHPNLISPMTDGDETYNAKSWKRRVEKKLLGEIMEESRRITEDLLRWRFGSQAVDAMQLSKRWIEPAVYVDTVMRPEKYPEVKRRVDEKYPDVAAEAFVAIVLECHESRVQFDPTPLDPAFFEFISNELRILKRKTIRGGVPLRLVAQNSEKMQEPYKTIWESLLLYYNMIPSADWDIVADIVEARFAKALPPSRRCSVM